MVLLSCVGHGVVWRLLWGSTQGWRVLSITR